jgi:hypothetical protein
MIPSDSERLFKEAEPKFSLQAATKVEYIGRALLLHVSA